MRQNLWAELHREAKLHRAGCASCNVCTHPCLLCVAHVPVDAYNATFAEPQVCCLFSTGGAFMIHAKFAIGSSRFTSWLPSIAQLQLLSTSTRCGLYCTPALHHALNAGLLLTHGANHSQPCTHSCLFYHVCKSTNVCFRKGAVPLIREACLAARLMAQPKLQEALQSNQAALLDASGPCG